METSKYEIAFLDAGEYLNDTIVDFYLRQAHVLPLRHHTEPVAHLRSVVATTACISLLIFVCHCTNIRTRGHMLLL